MAERRTHPNGGVYERGPDGKWHLVSGGPMNSPFVDPRLGPQTVKATNEAAASVYDPAQSAANVEKTRADTRRTEAITPAQVRYANAQADKAEAERDRIGQLPPEKRAELEGSFNSLNILEEGIREIEDIYQRSFKGKGALRSTAEFAAPGQLRPDNARLNDASNRLAAFISRALELTGRQFDTPREQQLFIQSYLPQNTDTDEAAESKIQSLIELLNNARRGMSQRLGTEFKPYESTLFPNEEKRENADHLPLMSHGGNSSDRTPTPTGDDTRTEFFPEASSYVDSLVRRNVPYSQALRDFQQRFPGAAPFDPRAYNDARQHFRANPGYTGSYGHVTKTENLSALEQGRNAFAQSLPGAFLGTHANALTAGIPSYLAGDQGQFAIETMRHQQPGASLAGEVTGGVGGIFGANRLLRPVLSNRPLLREGIADLGFGALYGATQNPGNEGTGALLGAGAAGAGNLAGRFTLGPALRVGGDALSRASERFLSRGGFTPRRLPSGENMLVNQAEKVGTEAITNQLEEAANLNLPMALADTSPQLRALAGSAVRKSPNVREIAEQNIGPRQLGQAERAIDLVNRNLAPTDDIGNITAGATTRARAASGDLYERAKAAPAPDDEVLRDMLHTPAGESAAREAYQIALNEGVSPAELSFAVGIDGAPIITANPNWQTLHYVRQGFDSVLEKSRDPVSGRLNLKDPSLRAMNDLRQRFSSRLHELNPDFAAADAEFARFAGQGSAASRGYGATSPRVTPDQTAGAVSSLPPEQLPFYRQGFASSLADTVERTRLASDPYNTIYGSPAQQQKLGVVFPEGAPTFARARGIESNMSKTHYETLGGSPTASRMEADKLFDGGNLGNMAEVGASMATGVPPVNAMTRFASQTIPDWWRLGRGQQRAEQIGPLLLNTNPSEAAAMLRQLADLAAARRAYAQQTRRAGGMFGAASGLTLIPNQ